MKVQSWSDANVNSDAEIVAGSLGPTGNQRLVVRNQQATNTTSKTYLQVGAVSKPTKISYLVQWEQPGSNIGGGSFVYDQSLAFLYDINTPNTGPLLLELGCIVRVAQTTQAREIYLQAKVGGGFPSSSDLIPLDETIVYKAEWTYDSAAGTWSGELINNATGAVITSAPAFALADNYNHYQFYVELRSALCTIAVDDFSIDVSSTNYPSTEDQADPILSKLPVVYWPMQEAPGATAFADSTFNGRDLVINGSPNLGQAGFRGRTGVEFPTIADTSYADNFTSYAMTGTANKTFCCWVNFADNQTRVLWSNSRFNLYYRTDNNLVSTRGMQINAPELLNRWHFVALRCKPNDASGQRTNNRILLNGGVRDYFAENTSGPTSSTNPLQIGGQDEGGFPLGPGSLMSDLMVFDYALTDYEILDIYKSFMTTYTDDFESYAVGDLTTQQSSWRAVYGTPSYLQIFNTTDPALPSITGNWLSFGSQGETVAISRSDWPLAADFTMSWTQFVRNQNPAAKSIIIGDVRNLIGGTGRVNVWITPNATTNTFAVTVFDESGGSAPTGKSGSDHPLPPQNSGGGYDFRITVVKVGQTVTVYSEPLLGDGTVYTDVIQIDFPTRIPEVAFSANSSATNMPFDNIEYTPHIEQFSDDFESRALGAFTG